MNAIKEIIEKRQFKLNKKWQENRPNYTSFVFDGILSIDDYLKQSPKILFLLKESNDNFVKIAPLSDPNGYGPKGKSGTFWRYMRGYEYIISSILTNQVVEKKQVMKIKERPNKNTAYVNIKKHDENKSNSNYKDILKYAVDDKDYIIEQIELINPDVIYCAGTFDFYKKIDKNYRKVSERIYKSNDRIIIDYLHLAHRKGYKTFVELENLLKSANLIESI